MTMQAAFDFNAEVFAAGNPKLAGRFRDMAEKLDASIEASFADRLSNTPKRMAQAASARLEGERLTRVRSAMLALAARHDMNTVPVELADIRSKKEIYELAAAELEMTPNGFHAYYIDTGKPRGSDPKTKALWELMSGRTPEEKAADELARKVEALNFAKIPGYFPTPPAVIEKMLERADIEPGMTVLEPSAGSGAILDALPDCIPGAYEISPTLREILEAKGWPLLGSDFMDADPDVKWDRVLMNPPFEKLADIDHVRKAYSLLADGGRLVSIMSPGPFFRETRKATEFREWFEALGGEAVELPAGSFKESGTGVSSRMVIIEKEAA